MDHDTRAESGKGKKKALNPLRTVKQTFTLERAHCMQKSYEMLEELHNNEEEIRLSKRDLLELKKVEKGQDILTVRAKMKYALQKIYSTDSSFDQMFLQRKRRDLVNHEIASIERQIAEMEIEGEFWRESQMKMEKDIDDEIHDLRNKLENIDLKIKAAEKLEEQYLLIIDALKNDEHPMLKSLKDTKRAIARKQNELVVVKEETEDAKSQAEKAKALAFAKQAMFMRLGLYNEIEMSRLQTTVLGGDIQNCELSEYMSHTAEELLGHDEERVATVHQQINEVHAEKLGHEEILKKIIEGTKTTDTAEMLASFEIQNYTNDKLKNAWRIRTTKLKIAQNQLDEMTSLKDSLVQNGGMDAHEAEDTLTGVGKLGEQGNTQLQQLERTSLRLKNNIIEYQKMARAIRDLLKDYPGGDLEVPNVSGAVSGLTTGSSLAKVVAYLVSKIQKLQEHIDQCKQLLPKLVVPEDMDEFHRVHEERRIGEFRRKIRIKLYDVETDEPKDSEDDMLMDFCIDRSCVAAPSRRQIKAQSNRIVRINAVTKKKVQVEEDPE